MKQHLKKFSSETEYNAYINGNPVLPNVSLIGDSGKVNFLTEHDYYINQYLTFEILEDGYIGLNDTEGLGLTVQYNKNNTGWTNLTSARCTLLTEEITVDGKEGTYTYGGLDAEMGMHYWENNGDKLYQYENYLIIGFAVFDSEEDVFHVLTTKNTPLPITNEITVDGKEGTYTYGGFDTEMGMHYWENNGDKLYGDKNYVTIGNSVWDSYWNEYQVLTTEDEPNNNFISVTEGDVLCFKGDNPTYNGTYFVLTGKFNVKGNIMSLIDSTNFTTATTLIEESAFSYLFGGTWVVSAKNLVLPATTLATQCYSYMFNDCTSLTTAPELPATTLATQCYKNMFYNCTSLTTAPVLPATTLAAQCYNSMFNGCTSLTTAPELPATALANYCYFGMFSNCTSLTTAPELPATALANYCYSNMFDGCTSLNTAPELPATTLAAKCYFYMFSGCTSLNYIKCLATDISASSCTYNWIKSVSSTGTFVKNASMSSWTTGDNGIPSGWTVQDAS